MGAGQPAVIVIVVRAAMMTVIAAVMLAAVPTLAQAIHRGLQPQAGCRA
jgi:hypothetical protein